MGSRQCSLKLFANPDETRLRCGCDFSIFTGRGCSSGGGWAPHPNPPLHVFVVDEASTLVYGRCASSTGLQASSHCGEDASYARARRSCQVLATTPAPARVVGPDPRANFSSLTTGHQDAIPDGWSKWNWGRDDGGSTTPQQQQHDFEDLAAVVGAASAVGRCPWGSRIQCGPRRRSLVRAKIPPPARPARPARALSLDLSAKDQVASPLCTVTSGSFGLRQGRTCLESHDTVAPSAVSWDAGAVVPVGMSAWVFVHNPFLRRPSFRYGGTPCRKLGAYRVNKAPVGAGTFGKPWSLECDNLTTAYG